MAKTEGNIEFAGDYDLNHVFLHTHLKEVFDIKKMMVELNVYESIFKNALTGSIVITDAQNLIAKLEINGTERISFRLSTPGALDNRNKIDASIETGHPFYVYKITDRRQIAPGTNLYTLHFASREFIRNLRTKVSQTYRGDVASQVIKILMDKNYLDSRKEISYEPTGNLNDVVIPNMRPFDAINMISKKTLPDKSKGVGYYFYETTKGIYFRSWDNMVSVKGSLPRPTKQVFRYMPMNVEDDTIEDKMNHDYQSVESYRFVNNFHDIAANTALGTYAHTAITYNFYDKSYTPSIYNYEIDYARSKHTDNTTSHRSKEKYAVAAESIVDTDDKKISDYAESRVSLLPTTQFLHGNGDNDTGAGYGLDVKQDGVKFVQGESIKNSIINGTTLHMVVKGQSYLEPGDLIEFKLVSVDEKNPDGEEDPQYSGRYVITKIRHQVNDTKYTNAIECVKDSTKTGFSTGYKKLENINNFSGIRNIYTADYPAGGDNSFVDF
jgi:hypothetical protein